MRKLLQRCLSLNDFEKHAQRHLPHPLFAYVSGGVEDNIALQNTLNSYQRFCLIPENMVDVSQRDIAVELFGHRYAAPVGIAPMGISAITGFQGDIALARAAASKNVPFIMSGSSLMRLEDVAAVNPAMWFQAYLPKTLEEIDALVDRVKRAGIPVLVVTVDTPVKANRENNVRAGFATPFRPSLALAWQGVTHPRWLTGTLIKTLITSGMPYFENNNAVRGAPLFSNNAVRDFSGRSHLTWQHIEHIRQRWPGAMVIKGILSRNDALRCKAMGIDGIVVSNHGGRQLDTVIPPIYVLPEIVEAAGDMTVMLDSGIRRGTDAIKALSLGAKACFVGRPFNYACAVGGTAGVELAIDLISNEVSRDIGMLGAPKLADLSEKHLRYIE
ncbi:alpha-hydroxy-acid oxidizing enzyme [Pantoea rodasii]|uniref:Alpha-hydroxy-acid oxidizing enzyme n=1 Tax=Pantoea rodasii TaxID=1076549 RepID=A0A2M9W632_9GAMM|nr:alpha-hydroxy acid oxidase [Pantoea rodasii]ORM65323.1 alpha-hydroxy-acid oxidizing enzyme [Pantoea rodasii]PJZ02969.1 alpha-hydroxy-acid oxidizing enzyme [Pantoea rodasii]